jgi:transposase
MAKGQAVAIVLDDAERRELTALTRKHGAPQALAERARIVLAAAAGLNNKEIAAKVGVCAATAGTWRNRFAKGRMDGLYDEPRPGAPRRLATTRSPPRSKRRWERLRKAQRTGA